MANLYSGTHSFSGYKTLAELTGLTFEANKTYTIQADDYITVREGTIGKGFSLQDTNPFTWTYNGNDDLYIGNNAPDGNVFINVAD